MVKRVVNQQASSWLICDIDGTLLGGDETHEQALISFLDKNPSVNFAIATGRELSHALNDLKHFPKPKLAICAVGSEIYFEGMRLESWSQLQNESWDKQAIHQMMQESDFELAPDEQQGPFKITYLGRSKDKEAEMLIETFKVKGIACKVVYSHDWFLDILPANSGKGQAILHWAESFAIEKTNIAVVGDSSNDIAMLELNGLAYSAVVSNYRDELKPWLNDNPTTTMLQGAHSAGVLELAKLLISENA